MIDPIDPTRNFTKHGAIINPLSRSEYRYSLIPGNHASRFRLLHVSAIEVGIQFRGRSELFNDFYGSIEYRLARVVNIQGYASVIK